jgi:ABC-type amino acid transport substrate-binding protein
MIEVPLIACVAGRGIRGDRYFDFKDDYKGQITFFSLDVFEELCAALSLDDCFAGCGAAQRDHARR